MKLSVARYLRQRRVTSMKSPLYGYATLVSVDEKWRQASQAGRLVYFTCHWHAHSPFAFGRYRRLRRDSDSEGPMTPPADQEIAGPPPPGPRFPVPAESGNVDSLSVFRFPANRESGNPPKTGKRGIRRFPIPECTSTVGPCCGRALASKFRST